MYKALLSNIEWNYCYTNDAAWKEIYVDSDSLIFNYMLEYTRSYLEISHEISGMNTCSTKSMTKYFIDKVSTYSLSRLRSTLEEIKKTSMDYKVVFGSGNIPEKDNQIKKYSTARKESFDKLSSNTGIGADLSTLKEDTIKYLLSERDTIRDTVLSNFDGPHLISEEPDIFCPKNCQATLSYDYDLFLFGSKYVIRNVSDDRIKFLSRESLLEGLGLKSISQLILVAALSGTDYNDGEHSADAIRMAISDDPIPEGYKKIVEFFLEKVESSCMETEWSTGGSWISDV